MSEIRLMFFQENYLNLLFKAVLIHPFDEEFMTRWASALCVFADSPGSC